MGRKLKPLDKPVGALRVAHERLGVTLGPGMAETETRYDSILGDKFHGQKRLRHGFTNPNF
jgi:hypothetical protein